MLIFTLICTHTAGRDRKRERVEKEERESEICMAVREKGGGIERGTLDR